MGPQEKIIDGILYIRHEDGWRLVRGIEGDFVADMIKSYKTAKQLSLSVDSFRCDELMKLVQDYCEELDNENNS